MVLAFILTVYIGQEVHSMGGEAAFRDIYNCTRYAEAIESANNLVWAGKRWYAQEHTKAYCLPKFVSLKNTKFWD